MGSDARLAAAAAFSRRLSNFAHKVFGFVFDLKVGLSPEPEIQKWAFSL